MKSDYIDNDSMIELGELILEMEDKLSKLELSKEHSEVIYRYIQEMHDSIIDFDIGGKEAFEGHVVVANGSVALYHNVFSENDLSDTVNKIYEKSTRILSDAQTWLGVIGGAGGYFIK